MTAIAELVSEECWTIGKDKKMSTYDSPATPDFGSEQPRAILRLSPLQRELLQWFEQHTPSLVEPYVAAMTLLQGPAFSGRATLVCFCMRDLGNILPRARNVQEEANTSESSDDTQTRTQGNLSGAKRKARAILQALPQLDVTEEEAAGWIDEVQRLLRWFSDHHHFSHKQREWPSADELRRNVERFERLLLRFTHTFFGLLQRAEQIIERVSTQGGVPTKSDANQLVAILEWSPEFQRPLLDRLGGDWLETLRDRNLFTDPPAAIHVERGGVRYAHWPPSKYLARMARQAAAEVARIFAKIETDNSSVIGDMVKAAFAMPADVAISLVPTICRAAREGTLWIYFKDAANLCVRLVEGPELEAAMDLAEALFTPSFEKGQEELSRRDAYWYKEGLRQVVPALAERKPREFLPKLCDWLKACVEAKKQVDPHSDHSYLWRPAIEEHEQNKDYDFAGVMVGFVREGFEEAVRRGGLSLEEAIQIVEPYPYLIFKRIRLHLIGEFADQSTDLARQTILNRDLIDDYQYMHEYAMLVGRRLDLLSPEQRDEWFGWIDAGPDMSDFDESVKNNLGRDATEEDRQSRVRYWKFDKLHWVRKHLDGERRDLYERMLARHGEPELADLNVRFSSGWVGDESPMTVEQLAEMTFEQAVDAVSSWRPEESRFKGPNIRGLSSTFEQYVATNPEEFCTKARILIGRPAIFVRGFLSQMSEAVKGGREIDLPAPLELCRWVLERPIEGRTAAGWEHEPLVDKNWQWTRDDISSFVENACRAQSRGTSIYPLNGLRQRMWQLIASLCHDRAESYIGGDITKDDPRLHDYLDLAINSPRGKAVEAALEYARWVANHVKHAEGKQEIVPGGFEAMPEVRQMLQSQIAPESRSFEAMSVIGSRIGLIYWIDKQWLAENADRLFNLEDIEQGPAAGHGWAAWNAFLVWVRPHIDFYRLFRSQFAYAVEQAAKVKLTERSRHQPMHRLGEHLIVLYGRGQLGLGDDESLLRRFVEHSDPEIRRHAIGFVGESLDADEAVRAEITERFQKLWDLYWAGPGRKDAQEAPNASLFGTWFSCGKFPDAWALDRLQQFVDVNPTPEPDDAIGEKLAELARVDVVKSVQILNRLVRGDQEGWRIQGWLDSAKRILEQAIETPGEAREQAIALIDFLARRGYTDFGELLR